eukprot:TRINITY_DN16198_c1_g1_i2.p1 TRINITY_DN16198_c1_g1~~TRINITY_DN16198_c1_g1_i2.p1  ORF type:complete len:465 (+),score=44.77 TRINITY_DN16198_c1_g1_i2:379-1773(+)
MLNIAAKRGSFEELEKVFAIAAQNGIEVSVDGWNASFQVLVTKPNRKFLAQALFKRMINSGVQPDIVTYNILLKASSSISDAEDQLRHLYNLAKENSQLTPNSRTFSSLLYVYAKYKDEKRFKDTLDAMRERKYPTKTSQIVLLSLRLYREINSLDKAFYLVDDLIENPVEPEYLLTNRIASMFLAICMENSKKRGDRADRYVDMMWKEVDRLNINRDYLVLSRFFEHYDRIGRVKCILDLSDFVKFHNIRTSSFIDNILKKHKKPDSRRKWEPSSGSSKHINQTALTHHQLVGFVRDHKVAEIQPSIYRLCRSLPYSEQYKLIDVVKLASAEVLKTDMRLNLSNVHLNKVGVTLLFCACAYYSMKQRQFSINSRDLFSCFLQTEDLQQYERPAAVVVSDAAELLYARRGVLAPSKRIAADQHKIPLKYSPGCVAIVPEMERNLKYNKDTSKLFTFVEGGRVHK